VWGKEGAAVVGAEEHFWLTVCVVVCWPLGPFYVQNHGCPCDEELGRLIVDP